MDGWIINSRPHGGDTSNEGSVWEKSSERGESKASSPVGLFLFFRWIRSLVLYEVPTQKKKRRRRREKRRD